MPVFFKHVWIGFIVVGVVNALILKSRSKKYTAKNPDLKDEYESFANSLIIYSNIPWIIMAIGMLTGMTKSTLEFLTPRQLNPIVTVFWLSMIALWIIGCNWVYFRGGAEKLVKYGKMMGRIENGNERFELMKIKIVWALGLLGGIIALTMMWRSKMTVDSFGL